MSANESPLITSKDQLIHFHAKGARQKQDWRIGTEHEKFGFRLTDLRPPEFTGEHGIEALLKGLMRFGWQAVEEKGESMIITLNPKEQFIRAWDDEAKTNFTGWMAQPVSRSAAVYALSQLVILGATQEQLAGARAFADILMNLADANNR